MTTPPRFTPLDGRLEYARGNIGEITTIRKFGRNPDVGTEFEAIWDLGGAYPFQTAASAVRIKAGGNAADTADGAGARSIVVSGLDETWAEASETIVTAGAEASAATTTTFTRVFRAYVLTSGTYGVSNTALIDIETTGGTTLARIAAGIGQTQMAIYTVPMGNTGYLSQLDISAATQKSFDVRMWQRQNADIVTAPMTPPRLISEFVAIADRLSRNYCVYPGPNPAKTDIWVTAKEAAGTTSCTVEFSMLLVAD